MMYHKHKLSKHLLLLLPPKNPSASFHYPLSSSTMASSSVFSAPNFHFKPLATSSRRNSKTDKNRTIIQKSKSRKQKSRNYPPPPSLSAAVEGGDATTFTRLPPREDFSSISLASESFAEVVKLSDAPRKFKNLNGSIPRNEIGVEKRVFGANVEFDSDNEGNGEMGSEETGFDYERFELYEVGSDDEFDDSLDGEGDEIVVGSEGGVVEEEEEEEDEEEEEEVKLKEKGLPAVMRCFDRVKIFVKAGDGGNGVMAFRREKFVPYGGPSGGDGGRGGNIYLEVDRAMNSLLSFRKSIHFRAGRGGHGQGQQKNGPKGKDVVIKVPPGTVVRDSDGHELLELLHTGQKALLLPGGRGGRGNASFKTNMNRVPKIAENGEEGSELWLDLELKLVADVGIVGAPNAGKSTFLSVISAAQPEIANYPFTTLLPNLGVVSFDYGATMVVADLPGLLEGAHRGFGLGHEFLRHTERCTVLVHIVDGSSQQPVEEFHAIRLELEMFNPELSVKPYIVAFNKMDLPEASENWPSFKKALQANGIEPFCMSAVTTEGTQEIITSAYKLVQKNKTNEVQGMTDPADLNYVADMMKKQRATPINEFDISQDTQNNTWHVTGSGLQRFVQMTNWRYEDSDRRFQHVLEACGVNKSLIKRGVKEGDTVVVAEMELVWHDAVDSPGPSSRRRSTTELAE